MFIEIKKKTAFMETEGLLIIKRQSPFDKISFKTSQNLRKMALLRMIVSNGQMLTGHDLDSGSLITYFCKKKVLTVL